MLQSMTGFATKSIVLERGEEKVHATLQLKTLNARYFEAHCRLPQPLFHLEVDIIKQLKKVLRRGTVYFTLSVDNQSFFKGKIAPDMNTVGNYVQAIDQIRAHFALSDTTTLEMITRLPNVFVSEEKLVDEAHAHKILEAINQLIERVIEDRVKEGTSIRADLATRVTHMTENIDRIHEQSEIMIDEQKEKINQLMKELDGDVTELAEIRKTALYTLLDKIDIHEEIVRFKNHVSNLTQALDSSELEKGKKLDFTLQEMGREINTIAAKCSNSIISALAINLKVEIEKAREQAQNVV